MALDAATGVVDIGSVSQTAVSRDGRTIVGTAKGAGGIAYAATWQNGKQWVTLPPPANARVLDGKSTVGYGVSADGSVMVGLAYLNPTRVEGFQVARRTTFRLRRLANQVPASKVSAGKTA